jgi:serine protease Do
MNSTTKIGIRACLAYLLFFGPSLAGVTPELQHAIRENTFEVVMKKPEKDPVTYEKPLPLDLIPFIERTDAYRSIGTAFSLGNNIYVTAGHVFAAGIGSQFGPPALRRADGKVFEIDHILKFSIDEDFVVFSLRENPAPAGLAVNRTPKLDDAVLAVGNALGEGIVIRDGLFTSETAEAQDGRWKWIRFSAAASPGNSGGPLCDVDGKVLGIVIGKSPNENLNYSLPIARVLDGEPMKARFDQKSLVSIPYMHGTLTYAYKDEFDLPLTWPAFVEAFQKTTDRHIDDARSQLLKKYADTLFPKGPGSEVLLSAPDANDFRPRLITQQADGTWIADKLQFHQIDLPGDGSVSFADTPGARLLSLVRSNAASDDAFYGDSKAFMDLALMALDLRRSVGTDQVRVTSLGSARSDTVYTDPYGRKWQERIWAVPFLDAYLVGVLLPTPEGYAGIVLFTPSASLQETKKAARLLAAQLDVSYRGDLAQWRAALRRPALVPSALSQVKIEKSSVWTLHTPRFVSSVTPEMLSLTDKSPFTLTMGFMNDGLQTVWDIQGARWDQDDRKDAAVELWRRMRPLSGAKLEQRNLFDSIRSRRSPFDGSLSRETVDTYSASSVLDVPGKKPGKVSSDLEYGVTVHMVRAAGLAEVAAAIRRVIAATQVLEHGVGEDLAQAQTQAATPKTASLDATTLRAIVDDWEQTASDRSTESEKLMGRDIRGRLLTDDVHDLAQAQRKQLSTYVGASSDADKGAWVEDQRQQAEWLRAYWSEYPALTHNRDIFVDFLAKNHMQPLIPHGANVMNAEGELRAALNYGRPRENWARLARALREAYIQERSSLVKNGRFGMPLTATFSPRTSPCPAAATTTTGTTHPRVASTSASLLDYWPLESRRLGEEGTVLASVRISSTGCLTDMSIVGSSGSDMLDGAVIKYLESVEFIPAGSDGQPMKSEVTIPIVFKLQ